MHMKTNRYSILLIVVWVAVMGCGPANENNCMQVTELMTSEITPAGVRTLFQVFDCDGNPVTDLANRHVSVKLDNKEIQSEGNVSVVLNQSVEFELNTLVLLDLSNSIVDNGTLQGMIAAARTLIATLVNQGHNVAIYRFAGPPYFGPVIEFTRDGALLNAALDTVAQSTGLGTTDLYGTVPKAVRVLENHKTADLLSADSLVLFTDGTDEAMVATASAAQNVINSTDVHVFTVGLGGDVNREELEHFGKDGFQWAENTDTLRTAFMKIGALIESYAHSYYLLGICSPRVGGMRQLEIDIRRNGQKGALKTSYDATGFDIVGCAPQLVAFPCLNRECGLVDGFNCGGCEGTDYCNASNVCEEACPPAIECGTSFGVDCGGCSGGNTFACDNNTCVDACVDVECGMVLGVDCGDCADRGASWICGADFTCVDACENRECGTSSGIDCGDCTAYGTTFGCAESGTCVEACGSVECGISEGVNCGDCQEFGSTFGCNSLGECVDVCSDAECGMASGIDCGECGIGTECNAFNECVPPSMDNMAWLFIEGGETTLGCDWNLDANCDFDEERHHISLNGFYIMDSEVTAGMYAECVDNGGCNPSNVTTTNGCTYNASSDNQLPVNCISWQGLQEFCHYIDGELPTEAQWERAFRGSHDGVASAYWVYPWGNSPTPGCDSVIMNEDGPGCGTSRVFAVRSLQPDSGGLFDMAGNVAEWTLDWYSDALGGCTDISETCVNPQGPASGDERVIRGGSFNSMYASAFRTATREKESPATSSSAIGGRCVRNN